MRLNIVVLTIVWCTIALLSSLSLSQLTPEQEQELTQRVLENVSPSCRAEIIESMETNKDDLSYECRTEIQSFMMNSGVFEGQPPVAEEQQQIETGLYDDQGNPVLTTKKSSKPRGPSWIHPVTAIIIFVVALFGGLAAYVVNYYQTVGFEEPKKPKKLSKKKVRDIY